MLAVNGEAHVPSGSQLSDGWREVRKVSIRSHDAQRSAGLKPRWSVAA